MTTATSTLSFKDIKKGLMGLDDKVLSHTKGLSLTNTSYKEGIKFTLKHNNDLSFTIACTDSKMVDTEFPILVSSQVNYGDYTTTPVSILSGKDDVLAVALSLIAPLVRISLPEGSDLNVIPSSETKKMYIDVLDSDLKTNGPTREVTNLITAFKKTT